MDVNDFKTVLPYVFILLKGAGVTVAISALALIFAVVIGTAVGTLATAGVRFAYSLTRLYVELIRSVPLLVLIFFAYYAIPVISKVNITPYGAATGALSIYGGAYMSEVVRSGIQSISKHQWEAARALGLRYRLIMVLIVFPQALRVMVPAGIGIFIDLIKGSSVASIIGFVELMQTAVNVRNTIYNLSPILLAGILYFCICFGLSRLGAQLEHRLQLGW
ncbi:MAG: amino acid ABC transporter permease [Terriglobales bacterium]